MGAAAERVRWLEHDVLSLHPQRRYDLWHDRAVFHFLVEPADRVRYLEVLDASLSEGGAIIVATFALDGPPTCSGLPVARYDEGGLAAEFGAHAVRVSARRERHTTPSGSVQQFTWVALRRRRSRRRGQAKQLHDRETEQ
jgi:hypothetical protein